MNKMTFKEMVSGGKPVELDNKCKVIARHLILNMQGTIPFSDKELDDVESYLREKIYVEPDGIRYHVALFLDNDILIVKRAEEWLLILKAQRNSMLLRDLS